MIGASKTEVFEDVATVLRPEGSKVTMRGDSGSEEIQASIVSGNFFDLLRVRPLLGHTFSSSEMQPRREHMSSDELRNVEATLRWDERNPG